MDMKDGDMVASVAIVREGYLSRVNETRSENGQPAEETVSTPSESTSQGELT